MIDDEEQRRIDHLIADRLNSDLWRCRLVELTGMRDRSERDPLPRSPMELIGSVLRHPNLFPMVIAFVLLGVFLGLVPSPITRTEALMVAHTRGEAARSSILRVMCRHQAIALRANPDECEGVSSREPLTGIP